MGEVATTQTLFQAASISKLFTATIALSLVERGLLDLDQDVNGVLKSWKVPENEYTAQEKVEFDLAKAELILNSATTIQ
jgi:CubicO group peptidase (beta-lactamase class C family)